MSARKLYHTKGKKGKKRRGGPLFHCQKSGGILFRLDPDTVNASRHMLPQHTVLCPKPHIGANVFDPVNADTDCLKNPHLCHVIGQPIVAPFVVRVTTAEQLTQQSSLLRTRSDELLYQVEEAGRRIPLSFKEG